MIAKRMVFGCLVLVMSICTWTIGRAAEDPGERYNIAAQHPDVLADLAREIAEHRKTIMPSTPLFDALLK